MAEFTQFTIKVFELLWLVYLAGFAFAGGKRTFDALLPKKPLTIICKGEEEV